MSTRSATGSAVLDRTDLRAGVPGAGVAPGVVVDRFGPARPFYGPGSNARVTAELVAAERARPYIIVELLDADRVVGSVGHRVRLPVGRSVRSFRLRLPDVRRHGYGLRLSVDVGDGPRAAASSAVETLAGWWESPRHVAVTELGSASRIESDVAALGDWHITVAQFYDWMYRHYRYEPPGDESFRDALGRDVSHRVVRAEVEACHRAGIASLAYGSVYGAEREYVEAHPAERVFDEAGRPLSLGEVFFINDLRPGRPWRRRLLGEYDRACRRFRFDGIHMDTYGPPYEAITADGERIRFADLYPGLIAAAAARLQATATTRQVLFNCVEGFPLDAVASSPAAALYLELWPPDVRYGDVVRWIEKARDLGGGKAVVIAAYLSAFRDAASDPQLRAGAFESAVLLTSVILAAGGYHHTLAEGDRLLVEGYYPRAVPMTPEEARELRAAWTFGARYVHLLSDPRLKSESSAEFELTDATGRAVPTSDAPEAGRVWVRSTRDAEGARVVQLVDLRDQPDDHWDALRAWVPTNERWRISWPAGGSSPVAMSPWTADGDAIALEPHPSTPPYRRVAPTVWGEIPPFRRWVVILDRYEKAGTRSLAATPRSPGCGDW